MNYGSKQECRKAAIRAAQAAGFSTPDALKEWVINRGWRSGEDVARFNRWQAYWLHVVQPLLWASESRDVRAQWVRSAHKGAFFLWLAGKA